ncbi:uncharacterized protein G2W53_027192 [Senna tora]|uniref:Uncharacterized protein n=1 Tax=Senna tora TaxID=362788 RepID=A0A834WGC3_9FABA|nr:uncharacterized protein G2W53_027192 [Senna tora]
MPSDGDHTQCDEKTASHRERCGFFSPRQEDTRDHRTDKEEIRHLKDQVQYLQPQLTGGAQDFEGIQGIHHNQSEHTS